MTPLFAWSFSAPEIAIILLIGVLLFGRRLPEIGRYLGKGIVEFKKGLKGMEDEVSDGGTSSYSSSAPVARQEPTEQIQSRPPQRVTASAPKFEEPAAPKFETPAAPKFEEPPAAPKPEEKPAAAAPSPPPQA
jgi:sec-independent protein translocase protein TatA